MNRKWGFPKIRGTFLGVPIIRIRIIVYWGLYWGPLILGNYQMARRVYKVGMQKEGRGLAQHKEDLRQQ